MNQKTQITKEKKKMKNMAIPTNDVPKPLEENFCIFRIGEKEIDLGLEIGSEINGEQMLSAAYNQKSTSSLDCYISYSAQLGSSC